MILIDIKSHITKPNITRNIVCRAVSRTLMACAVVIGLSVNATAQRRPVKHLLPDSLSSEKAVDSIPNIVPTNETVVDIDSVFETFKAADTIKVQKYDVWEERSYEFNPDPTRAVWMSALFPGLGQIYNRRYWKLPIIIGGYLGLAYATSWNNGMLDDYTKAYRDIMDSDPTTKSYMDFFPPTVKESDLDSTWLTNILQSRKNYYRRNRDLCIICMVGVYFIAMVDAYVDASLSHFDVTPDLSMDVAPAIFQETRGMRPAIGLQWALTF